MLLKRIAYCGALLAYYIFLSVCAHKAVYLVPIGLAIINTVIFYVRPRAGLFMFIPFMLLSEWASRYDIRSTENMASIHTIYFGAFNLFTYMLVFFAAIILFRYPFHNGKLTLNRMEKSLSLMILVYIIAAVAGIPNAVYYPREYISDIAPLVNFLCGYILIKYLLPDLSGLKDLVWLFLYCFSARALIGIIWNFMGSGYSEGMVLIPFYDPVGAFPAFVVSVAISILIYTQQQMEKKIFLWGVILISIAFFLMWPSRAAWIVMISAVFFVCFFSRWKDKIIFFGIVIGVGYLLYLVLRAYASEIIDYAMWKISTLQYLSLGLEAPTTISQRFVEGYNIIRKLVEEWAILWGKGAGSWFDDKYFTFPIVGESEQLALSAYSYDQLQAWKFFRPHDTYLIILLKAGVIGIVLYMAFIYRYLKTIFLEIRRCKYSDRTAIIVGLSVPFINQLLGFSPKNYVMAGILFGIIVNILKDQRNYEHAI